MIRTDLIERLAGLPTLSKIPRAELEWLVKCGKHEMYETGQVIAPTGVRIGELFILLCGHIAIRVDRGAGPRRIFEWHKGDVTGLLPYSRMTGTPGDTYVEETAETLAIPESHFPEMIIQCPVFTAHTVHIMLDRARSFNTSDLQDEKMISLGKLAAGMAHEINNPASAVLRGAKQLPLSLAEADAASLALGRAGLTDDEFEVIARARSACLIQPDGVILSPIQKADRESDIAEWLVGKNLNPDYAESLAATTITIDLLNKLTQSITGKTLDSVFRWITAGCAIHSLALDIEQAATRIYGLVAAVKKFTYMDQLAGPDYVDVESGIQDTIRIVGSKVKEKNASITVDFEENLPRVNATGGEINQVWLNLIDNALDAIEQSGNIHINVHRELDRVVVCLTDDGPGIPEDTLPKIFDPFYTTKPPGKGTGLGLEIARRLVRRYYGDISVQSRPGHTEFRVSLMAEKS
jgi:signal transduction histidine kinase